MFNALSALSSTSVIPAVTVLVTGLVVMQSTAQPTAPSPAALVAGTQATDGGVTVMEATPVTFRLQGPGTPQLKLTIRNGSAKEQHVTWELRLRDGFGTVVPMSGPPGSPTAVPPYSAETITLDVAAIGQSTLPTPLSGWILIKTFDPPPSGKATGLKSLDVRVIAAPSESRILLRSAVAAGVAVALSAVLMALRWRRGGGPARKLGTPQWQPADSWATNAAVGATFLTGLLQWVAVPEHMLRLSKPTYLLLALLFAALVALAPLVYSLVKTVAAGAIEKVKWLILPVLLTASFFTCVGAIGQLGTLVYVFGDLADANLISAGTRLFFEIVLKGLIVLVFVYVVGASYLTVFAPPPAVVKDDLTRVGRSFQIMEAPLRRDHADDETRPWSLL